MTKAELVEIIVKKVKLPKTQVEKVLDATIDTIKKTIKKEGRFSYTNFGSFILVRRKQREGRHPQTGEVIKIKASKNVTFKPARRFKNSL